MRRSIYTFFTVILVSALLWSCGASPEQGNTTLVSLTIGGEGRTARLETRKNTLIARVGLYLRQLSFQSTAIAAIPANIQRITFTISGEELVDMVKEIVINGETSVTETFVVGNGPARYFLLEAKSATGVNLFSGNATADLEGLPVSLNIAMTPIPQPGTKLFGSTEDDEGEGIVLDSTGNIYLAGGTRNGLDGSPNSGYSDAFLTRYDSTRIRRWTEQNGSTGFDYGFGVVSDASDLVYMAGIAGGNFQGFSSIGGTDLFVSAYDMDGLRHWLVQAGSAGNDHATSIAIDGGGDLYVTGYTDGDLDGNTNAGGYDLFLTKYNASGTLLWTEQLGSAADDYGMGVAVDGTNIYVTGYTAGDLGGANAGGYDLFIVKFASGGGAPSLIVQHGTPAHDEASAIVVDSGGNLYITGGSEGSLDTETNGGMYDLFLMKYSGAGTRQWTTYYSTAGNDHGADISISSSDEIYVTGGVKGGADGGDYDIFLGKYDTSGNKTWSQETGTAGNDYGTALAVDSAGDIYVTGYTNGNLAGLTNAGGYDIFMSKYDLSGLTL